MDAVEAAEAVAFEATFAEAAGFVEAAGFAEEDAFAATFETAVFLVAVLAGAFFVAAFLVADSLVAVFFAAMMEPDFDCTVRAGWRPNESPESIARIDHPNQSRGRAGHAQRVAAGLCGA